MQRAAELQAGDADVGEGLTAEEVVALGREVGIPGRYLQQAMLEQATSVVAPAEAGLIGGAVGPAEVSADRVVVADPDAAAGALIRWFEKNELLVLQRQQSGRLTWEPLRGMQAALRQAGAAFDSSKPRFMLGRAELVAATLTRLESGYCHVALTATLRETRGQYVGGAAGLASAGAAGTLILASLGAFWAVALAPLPLALGLAWGVTRRFRPVAHRTLLGLERALDFLERGGIKPAHQLPPKSPSLIETLAGELRKAITSSTEKRPSK